MNSRRTPTARRVSTAVVALLATTLAGCTADAPAPSARPAASAVPAAWQSIAPAGAEPSVLATAPDIRPPKDEKPKPKKKAKGRTVREEATAPSVRIAPGRVAVPAQPPASVGERAPAAPRRTAPQRPRSGAMEGTRRPVPRQQPQSPAERPRPRPRPAPPVQPIDPGIMCDMADGVARSDIVDLCRGNFG